MYIAKTVPIITLSGRCQSEKEGRKGKMSDRTKKEGNDEYGDKKEKPGFG